MSGTGKPKIVEHVQPVVNKYTVFYTDDTEVIDGYPQMAFMELDATTVEEVIKIMGGKGIPETKIQSIDQHHDDEN